MRPQGEGNKLKSQAVSRNSFIRGRQFSTVIRPPWAIDEDQFTEICTRCFECAKACPAHLIIKGTGGFPEISFSRHGCDYCEACVVACPETALDLAQPTAWDQQAVINESCFSRRGVVCRSCGEVCEASAIYFKPALGGVSQIQLNASACNGCGECVHVCPAHAIKIQKIMAGEIHE